MHGQLHLPLVFNLGIHFPIYIWSKMAIKKGCSRFEMRVVIMSTFFITGGTAACNNDNLWCQQWRHSWHHDNSRLSVFTACAKLLHAHHPVAPMVPTLLLMAASHFVITTTCGSTRDNKTCIMTTLISQWLLFCPILPHTFHPASPVMSTLSQMAARRLP